jgi:hypothetical protein
MESCSRKERTRGMSPEIPTPEQAAADLHHVRDAQRSSLNLRCIPWWCYTSFVILCAAYVPLNRVATHVMPGLGSLIVLGLLLFTHAIIRMLAGLPGQYVPKIWLQGRPIEYATSAVVVVYGAVTVIAMAFTDYGAFPSWLLAIDAALVIGSIPLGRLLSHHLRRGLETDLARGML